MSDVKRVTLTTISDVVKKGVGSAGPNAIVGGPFGALSLNSDSDMSSAFGNNHTFGGGSLSPADKDKVAGGSGNETGGGPSPTRKKQKTVRINLNLFEPTADSCPEFNFSKLIQDEQKRLKKAQKKQQNDSAASNGFLSEPELDNDVARMARELERKYGSGTAYASKGTYARPTKLDSFDRGAGYDNDDSFIDNSVAYDELIPSEIETVGGGFYINSGPLEFKQLSNYERPDDVRRMPKPKKRALSTTSDSSDDEEPSASTKKKPLESRTPASSQSQQQSSEKPATANPEQQLTADEKVNSAANSGTETVSGDDRPCMNGHAAKKQKLLDSGQVVKSGGVGDKEKAKSATEPTAKEKANGVKGKGSSNALVSGVPTVPVAGGKKGENENDGSVKLIKTTTVKDMLRAKRDSLRKMEQEKKGRSSGSSRVSSSEAEEDGDGGGDQEDEDEENDEEDDEDDDEDDVIIGSDKNSNESGSEEVIGSESDSSREGANAKDAVAKGKIVTNGPENEGQRPGPAAPEQQPKEAKRKESKLPDELPETLRKDVEALKELAQSLSVEGKFNYFDTKVAELLLQIDERGRVAGNATRNAVFRHLEAQLSISRQSLQLKLKKIRIRKLDGKAKVTLSQLEDIICDVMPIQLTKYQIECGKVADMRAAAQAAAAAAAVTNAMTSAGGAAMTNGEKPEQTPPLPAVTPQIRNPKKRFYWNERARQLLEELCSIRLQTFALQRPRNETEDSFLADYMRSKLVPLWPEGWMRYEDLHKELDRRKKAMAKNQGPAGKKQPMVVLPNFGSALPSGVDATWLMHGAATMNGLKADGQPGSRAAMLPSASGKSGNKLEAVAPALQSQAVTTAVRLSPDASHKRTSDHSISNIINSPPLPLPAGDTQKTVRHSFDERQLMLSPPIPPTTDGVLSFNAKRASSGALAVSPTDLRQSHLSVGDIAAAKRQRWSSREEDSDNSVEFVSVTVPGSAASVAAGAAVGGVLHSGKSNTHATLPGSASTHLPVLNKEKYKNLIAGKNKGGGVGSSGSASPVGTVESPVGGGIVKYSKLSPTGGSVPFAAPSGASGGLTISEITGTTSMPSQQQHEPITDFSIDCVLDEEDFLFATNSYSYAGGRS